VGVGVGHEAGLEHFVWAWADAWDEVGGFEGGLFDLGVVVFGVFVEFHLADFDEGEVCVGPDFGEIERVPLEGVGLLLGHDLDFECPAWEVAFFDGVEEVALVGFAVLADDFGGFVVHPVFDALVCFEVELAPDALVVGVDE